MSKVCLVSLGCAKNLIDSEQMLSLLDDAGFELTDDPAEADAAIVNTCAFIESAKTEAIENILSLAELKKTGSLKKLIVTGCLAQRYGEELLREMPEIDGLVGTGSVSEIINAINNAAPGAAPEAKHLLLPPLTRRAVSSPPAPAGPISRSPRAAPTGAPTASYPPSAVNTAPVPWRI